MGTAPTMIASSKRRVGRGAEISRIGSFRITSRLGEGSSAFVYRAKDTVSGRPVVVKVLKDHIARKKEHQQRHQLEVEVLRKLRHPNIVHYLASGSVDGRSYFVMDYVRGESLKDMLAQERILHPRRVAEIGRDIATALTEAHERRILHRDLKPANILISGDGSVKVMDFGLAKNLASTAAITATGVVLGTPAYMSPEQVRGDELGARTDLYALGVILYEALLGLNPFKVKGDCRGTFYRHLKFVPRRVNIIRREVPRALSELVSQLLEKNPHKRPASAFHVMAQLDRILRSMDRVKEMAARRRQERSKRADGAACRRPVRSDERRPGPRRLQPPVSVVESTGSVQVSFGNNPFGVLGCRKKTG